MTVASTTPPVHPLSAPTDRPQTLELAPEALVFDYGNPRLLDGTPILAGNETEMVSLLTTSSDVRELLRSIAANGFMAYDEMVAVLQSDGKYKVIEGNRRLAALRLFRVPGLATILRLDLPELRPEAAATMNIVPVKVVANEAAARAYIGFKHINGPHKWGALAKAAYAVSWLDGGGNIDEIARSFGDTNSVIRRLVVGYRVMQQAQAIGIRREDVNKGVFPFAYLYTAVSQSGFREYLGLTGTPADRLLQNSPVPETHLDELKRVWMWLFGSRSEGREAVVRTQNPNLQELNRILQVSAAQAALVGGQGFDRAKTLTEPAASRFSSALQAAASYAAAAAAEVSRYDGDKSQIEAGESLKANAEMILSIMIAKQKPIVGSPKENSGK